MNREKLPYRKNCEGYFVYNNKFIIAKDRESYIEFPGGGVENNEELIDAVKREALEEAGAIISEIKPIGVLYFIWDKNWAKTIKQKERYKKFKGEEMHFFIGKVNKILDTPENGNKFEWEGKKIIEVKDIIKKLNNLKPYSSEIKEYREFQLKIMNELLTKSI